MNLYGSLQNRLEENKVLCKEIKVGTGVTEYLHTDKKPYEVVKVIDQKHVSIRRMDVKRIDKNGMSDDQQYEYISNINNPVIDLVFKNGSWYQVISQSKKEWLKRANELKEDFKTLDAAYNYIKMMSGLTNSQEEKIESGKEVKKYIKKSLSFGIMKNYFDYSF